MPAPDTKGSGGRASAPRTPTSSAAPAPAAKAAPKPDGPFVLEIINGTHRTETVFEK